ncbi:MULTISPECIES: hypothetical protein [unclassified Streptomyces]|uniref:hypothetical protein n=1 Tax=unclassified Streptomyces TaxID=2593676 RepID=UPI00226E478D|nr:MULTISPECIES: hypothetical protein [unclassified Streptomyces]MCY0922676.1 hypothetical protein [Streptomyces sp. H27-G5]MCY0963042.1 hypothetical protein [Streptomyces sp. H27-H5]
MGSTFAVHRTDLYRALRLPVPVSPAEEQAAGRALTVHLLRGSDDPTVRFVP